MRLKAAIKGASLPALDFCARFLLIKAASLDGEHPETAGLFRALLDDIDTERDRRVELEAEEREAAIRRHGKGYVEVDHGR